MRKRDLKTGMVVELRDGARMIVINRGGKINFYELENVYSGIVYSGNLYSNTLRCHGSEDDDITKVFRYEEAEFMFNSSVIRHLLWERIEPKKMTFEDIEKALGYEIELVNG